MFVINVFGRYYFNNVMTPPSIGFIDILRGFKRQNSSVDHSVVRNIS